MTPSADPATTEPIWLTSSDGTQIALHRLGGDGPPMIVSHATGFHAKCYLPMVRTLGARHTVWGIDYRGHGQSQIDHDASFVWTDFADDLLAAIDHLGSGPIPAFGHSMGGATILLAETKRPGTISAAYVYEPIIFPVDIGPRNSEMAAMATRRRAEFPSRADALARYASRPPLNTLRADALHAYVHHGFLDTADGAVRLACLPKFEAMTFAGANTPASAIAGVHTPTVVARGVVHGDDPAAADFSAGTAAALPNGRLQTYDRIGHFGPLEAPDVIAEDILAAFAEAGTDGWATG